MAVATVRAQVARIEGTTDRMINVGDIVDGKYCVTRILGQGGMGTVVEAHHAVLDMYVAIKFMRLNVMATSDATERFLREARALVKLKSQHAVKVHDLGVHEGMPYIVMERLEGMDMQTILDKHGPMSGPDAARYVRQACEAIAEAHSHGIYHRDLKPANLFLAHGPEGKIIVKVLDFGIAKILRSSEKKPSAYDSLTGANIFIGTLPYMSPEQIASAKDIDGRADIWSLGVVLHELVTGELPFQGRDLYEVQQAIRYESCIMPALPSSLAPIIRCCLQKNREDRYASAADLACALRALAYESFSPFGTTLPHVNPKALNEIVIRSATASPLPAPPRDDMDFAAAEGLAPSPIGTPSVVTTREPRLPRFDDLFDSNKLESGNEPENLPTLRMAVAMAPFGTVIMADDTPEPPTVKRPPSDRPDAPIHTMPSAGQEIATPNPAPVRRSPWADMKPQVVTVRRGVLVVEQPIQLSRRPRGSTRKHPLSMGALAMCALTFGLFSYLDQSPILAASLANAGLVTRDIAPEAISSPSSPEQEYSIPRSFVGAQNTCSSQQSPVATSEK